ncbi:hypothetical protein [uncultured Arthrobacter sp.]|uniref:hypothetical protein n=1 Tax=uncultured Arthrobacter sp. TaxID=114050 RepID=UPI0028D1E175|nr:hypothetical protein [uncultured Arthrobacter sp.]
MPTTVLATALPHSLGDSAPFQLTVFFTHKLTGAGTNLSDFPAATDWVSTLGACTLSLTTSLEPNLSLPLRIVSAPDGPSWSALLPPETPVAPFPTPSLSGETWRTNPASRMSDHAVDLHLAAITAAPTLRPAVSSDPVALGLLETLANLDQDGPLRRLLDDAPARARRRFQVPAQRLRNALTTIGPLTGPDETDPRQWHGGELPPPQPYQSTIEDQPSPVQTLLDDPEADLRVTRQLDELVGQDLAHDPQLRMIVDAHSMRRYYERPEQPQQAPRPLPDPSAPPTPRPAIPEHDFHAKVASFGSTPALLRRLGFAVDVVLDGIDAAAARTALTGATWVSVTITSQVADLEVLPPRRTSVVVDGAVFAARSSEAWVGGALPLGDEEWVVLDTDPDASGLKLDQHARNLARQYASEANGDPATSAPGILRATGFALARRDRAGQVRERVQAAEQLAADDGTRELVLDDLVRGIRIEVWDDVTQEWHSLHQRRVTVTGEPGGLNILHDAPDVGFLQLSALNRAPGDTANRYYLHEVVAGWDGWSLSAPRPGLTIVHVEPPGPDGTTETVVETPADEPLDGAHITTRVEPKSLPRLRYGTSYSFRVLAVDLAGNSIPQIPPEDRRQPAEPDEAALAAARTHLDWLRERYAARDRASLAAAGRAAVIEHLRSPQRAGALPLADELLSGDARIDAALQDLITQAIGEEPAASAAQHQFNEAVVASRILAESRDIPRIRPQLRVDAAVLANLARNDDLLLPEELRRPTRFTVTTPRPYLRWEPVPAPTLVPRHKLGPGEQVAHLVVRSGSPGSPGPATASTAERHLAPPKATQLEAEVAGHFDAAIGTGNTGEIRRLYAVALAERGTLLDQYAPSLHDPRTVEEQPGIALVDRPGADTESPHRATLADITANRGRPIGEGQYVVHDTDALRLPYLPDPYAAGVSLVFYEAGAPHLLPHPRALQAVTVPYPGQWPSLQPLRFVLEGGETLGAQVSGHEIRVTVPPGEQVRLAVSSTLKEIELGKFGLWRSHLASVVDPSDGYTPDELVASVALTRAAASGWTWWLTPSIDVRLVHALPTPARPPVLSDLSLFLRPPGRAVAAFSGLVDIHGSSTDTLIIRASWTEQVDDVTANGPQEVSKSDVVVHSSVGERERSGVLFLYDFLPEGPLYQSLENLGFHRMLQTFEDTHYRRVAYTPGGTSRFTEFFEPSQIPEDGAAGEQVLLDIPSSARPAAPVVLDSVPLLRWQEQPDPDQPFAWQKVRRSGVRIWLARPWFSSGDGELLGVLLFDPYEWVQGEDGSWKRQLKGQQAPDGATSLWAADPIIQHGGTTSTPTVPPLLTFDQLVLDVVESSAAQSAGIQPPLGGEIYGGRDRGWQDAPGSPVTVAGSVPLRDVRGHPSVRVLGYRPEYDQASGRWFVDVALQETPALWPFVRLAVSRYQPHSIEGCSLSPVALTNWVQPLPTRTLTVSRPDRAHVQVTLTGVVGWLRWDPESEPSLTGEQLSADSPTGAAATRAARLHQSRTVHATAQNRPADATDLEWQSLASTTLVAGYLEETGGYRATWTGSVALPEGAGTPAGDAAGYPGLRRPGGEESSWRLLIEEHELLNGDPSYPGDEFGIVPRLVYADVVSL